MQFKQHDKSHIVELSDGSAWRIWPGDISMTLQWLPTTELDIAGIEDEGLFARAGQMHHGCA